MKYLKKFEYFNEDEKNIDDLLDKMNQKGGDRSSLSTSELNILKNKGKDDLNDIPNSPYDMKEYVANLDCSSLSPRKLEKILSLTLMNDFETATHLFKIIKEKCPEVKTDKALLDVWNKYIKLWHDNMIEFNEDEDDDRDPDQEREDEDDEDYDDED